MLELTSVSLALFLWCHFVTVGAFKWFPGYGNLHEEQKRVHPKPMGASIKIEIVLLPRERQTSRCNPNI